MRKLILLLGILLVACTGNDTGLVGGGDYDALAQCMTDSEVKFYGAYWCTNCQKQKEDFGASWGLIDAVECSTPDGQAQVQVCTLAGIKAYPTWEFPDGSRKTGRLPLEELSELSSCSI
ncbi:hypothetical protein ACFL1B_02070 [Nanoarchaeota archaeon]